MKKAKHPTLDKVIGELDDDQVRAVIGILSGPAIAGLDCAVVVLGDLERLDVAE